MEKITYTLVAVFSLAVIMISCKNQTKKEKVKEEVKIEKQEIHDHSGNMANAEYQCPMDCEHGKTYDKEGNCPVCNMKLKKVKSKDMDSSTSLDSTKVSSTINCKGKMDFKFEMGTNKKTCSKCDSGKWACKSNADSSNKECTKCKTKSCKEKA